MVRRWSGDGGLFSCRGRAEEPEGRALVLAEVAESSAESSTGGLARNFRTFAAVKRHDEERDRAYAYRRAPQALHRGLGKTLQKPDSGKWRERRGSAGRNRRATRAQWGWENHDLLHDRGAYSSKQRADIPGGDRYHPRARLSACAARGWLPCAGG